MNSKEIFTALRNGAKMICENGTYTVNGSKVSERSALAATDMMDNHCKIEVVEGKAVYSYGRWIGGSQGAQ